MQRLGMVMTVAEPNSSSWDGSAPRALTWRTRAVNTVREWTMCGFSMVVFFRRMAGLEKPKRMGPGIGAMHLSSLSLSLSLSLSDGRLGWDATATCLDLKVACLEGLVNRRVGVLQKCVSEIKTK